MLSTWAFCFTCGLWGQIKPGPCLPIFALRLRNKRNKRKKFLRSMGLLAFLMEDLLVNTVYGGARRDAQAP